MKILLVEDDEGLAELLSKALSNQHYLVEVAFDGQAGLELAGALKYDLILLDFMLPKLDGISLCRQLRQDGNLTPILLLTSSDSKSQRVEGLDAGADDYIVKSCDFEELLARIRALLRRGHVNTSPIIAWGNLRLDPSSCEVSYNKQPLSLTSKEYALIELFLRDSHRIFSQSALLDRLWSFDEPPLENTVRAHIKSLRKKLKQAGAEDLIETVYGLGYRLRVTTPADQAQQAAATTATELQIQQISPELLPIWERHREKYRSRLTILENAIAAFAEDRLDETLRQQALQEAHTLKGSLGSFGLTAAAATLVEIEENFKAGVGQHLVSTLQAQVRELQSLLQQPFTAAQYSVPQYDRETLPAQQPRLLVVGEEILSAALVAEASAWRIDGTAATSLTAARQAISQTRPDVVLLDLDLADSAQNSFELMTELGSLHPPIPVVVLAAQENLMDRINAVRLGGQGFLQKPIADADVIGLIVQILEKAKTPEAALLIVDNDPQMLDFLHRLLTPWGFHLTLLSDPSQFWHFLKQTTPDLLILDIEMPEFNGLELCKAVRNDPDWSELPILFLSAHSDAATVHRVFEAGGDDYINKPILGPELLARLLNRLERVKTLARRNNRSAQTIRLNKTVSSTKAFVQ